MGLRYTSDYVYNALAKQKNPRIFIRLKRPATIIIAPESINIYRFKAMTEVPNFKFIMCMLISSNKSFVQFRQYYMEVM